ncbi:hypothetical protein BH20PSE1_BH20PSE1_04390 [soil metagenome]
MRRSTFLEQLIESIGIVLNTLQANARTEELLKQSQSLTQELQNGQLELQATNQRLEQQARSLQVSEERLREQQEELQQTNTDLEDKAKLLAEQNREVERKNHQIEVARQELEEKAVQLALSSKYKSEFLANMSYELRTPLNSMLVLSQLLAENAEGNLTEKQREYASTIHSSGTDLLTLINEILDLAKIEAGHMDVHITGVAFTALRDYVERTFREMASEKRLDFSVDLDGTLPEEIYTDSQRLQQVLRNLLSNAFKFTAHGQVVLRVAVALDGWSADQEILNRAETVVAFAVSDTGIGISLDRQRLVFEAFQQADGTTSRKFGGTGLGLSISREIATLLRGELRLSSAPAKGSIFTLYLPLNYVPRPERRGATESPSILQRLRNASDALAGGAIPVSPERDPAIGHLSLPEPVAASEEIEDDRGQVQPGDQVLLIVEDDPAFARVLLDRAHLQGFKAIVSTRGAPVPDLARRFRPAAILLDIGLPDTSGWMLLDRLKHSVDTRHIPVHVISVEDAARRGIRLGAIGWLKKPVTREGLDEALSVTKGFVERTVRNILVVEDDAEESQRIVELIGNSDTQTRAVKAGSEALEAVNSERFDCMVLDLSLKDISAFRLIKDIREAIGMSHLPIIVYTRKPLTRRQAGELKRLASTMVIGPSSPSSYFYTWVNSPHTPLPRACTKSTLLLHRAQGRLPASKQALLEQVLLSDPELSGKRVLIIDDDARNVFALASLLEHHHLEVSYAESGQAGIQMIENAPGIDLVLMDVMPDMDGFETMRRIRTDARFRSLPIIALTAKAMKGDRDRCLEAGASDFIAKPIDNEQLLSMLRVWASAEEA